MAVEQFIRNAGLHHLEQIRKPEIISVPEIELINGNRAIGVFGRNGAGNTSLGESLLQALGPNAQLIDAGKDIREATGNNSTTIGFMARNTSLDIAKDEEQLSQFIEATPDSPLIAASKLSGYLMRDVEGTFRILVTAPRDVCIARIRRRALKEINQLLEQNRFALNHFSRLIKQDPLSKEEANWVRNLLKESMPALKKRQKELSAEYATNIVLDEELDRESKDFEHWSQVYEELEGLDIYSPAARLPDGSKLYDLTLSTDKRSKEETVRFVIDQLVERGIARLK